MDYLDRIFEKSSSYGLGDTSILDSIGSIKMVTIPKKFAIVEIVDKSSQGIILGLEGVKTRLGNDHPDWELNYINENDGLNILRDYFPSLAAIWERIPTKKSKENIIRYAWLSINGGVSIETSITLNKPIDNLFFNDSEVYLLRDPSVKYGVSTEILASKRGTLFWKEVLHEVELRLNNKSWWVKGEYLNDRYLAGEDMLTDVAERTTTIYSIISPTTIVNQNITSLNTNKGYTNSAYSYYMTYRDSLVIFMLIIIIILSMIILYMSFNRSNNNDQYKYYGSARPSYLRSPGQVLLYE